MNQTFSYQFRYKDFWKSLTTEPEDFQTFWEESGIYGNAANFQSS